MVEERNWMFEDLGGGKKEKGEVKGRESRTKLNNLFPKITLPWLIISNEINALTKKKPNKFLTTLLFVSFSFSLPFL